MTQNTVHTHLCYANLGSVHIFIDRSIYTNSKVKKYYPNFYPKYCSQIELLNVIHRLICYIRYVSKIPLRMRRRKVNKTGNAFEVQMNATIPRVWKV